MTSSNSRRFSIGFLMAIIFLVAIDIGCFREFLKANGSGIQVASVTFPMANVLLLMFLRLGSGVGSRRFQVAFQVAGWVMVLIFGVLAWLVPHWLFHPINAFQAAMGLEGVAPRTRFVIFSTAFFGYMTPQLLIALLAGWLSSRYRVGIGSVEVGLTR